MSELIIAPSQQGELGLLTIIKWNITLSPHANGANTDPHLFIKS